MGSLFAADEIATSIPTIRRAFVPADRPREWPAGDWIPLAADEFATLIRDAEARSEPRAAVIDRAEYSATLVGDVVAGRCELVVRRFVNRTAAVSLGPLNVALTNLRWADGTAATWGLAPNGETLLIVDRSSGRITADWKAPTRRLAQTIEVPLQLPSAVISTVALQLPVDRVLRSSIGDVAAEAPAANDLRAWRVHLGHTNQCRLSIRPTSVSSTVDHAAMLVRQEFSGVVRPEGLRMQCDFHLEFLGSPRHNVEFVVSPEFQVLFVQTTDGRPLTWRESTSPEEKRLTVELPPGTSATNPSLRVQGTVPTTLDRSWMLPRLRLADGVLLDGQIALRVDLPLVLALVQLQGCRQAGVVTETASGEVLLLKQFDPHAVVEFLVRPRPFDAACRVTTHLNAEDQRDTTRVDLAWSVRGGEAFVTSYRIADGWDVHDVEMQDGGDDDLSGWSAAIEPGRGRVLTVSFRNSLATDRPKRLRVLLRRTTVEADPVSLAPIVIPLDTEDAEQVAGLRDLPFATPVASTGGPATDRLRVRSLQLDSRLALNAAADDWHSARFHLVAEAGSRPTRFEWLLPEPAEVASVTVNGRDAPPRTDGRVWSVDVDGREWKPERVPSGRGVGAALNSAGNSVGCEIELGYRQPAAVRFAMIERTIVLPRIAFPIEQFATRIAVPRHILLDGKPRGLTPADSSPGGSRWSRWFGPLGRAKNATVFSPLRSGDWADVWSAVRGGSWGTQLASAAGSGSVGHAHGDANQFTNANESGWQVWRFNSDSVPTEIRLRMWDGSRAALLAWVALLGSVLLGLLLRMRRKRQLDWPTMAVAGSALTVSLLASPVVTVISGGCLSGLVLAQLLPWTWFRRPTNRSRHATSGVPTGSTQSFVVSPLARMVIGAAAVAWSAAAWAQVDSPAVRERSEFRSTEGVVPATFDVLVPTGPDGQPPEKSAVVYVSSELHTRLRALQQAHRAWRNRELPAYLISSARYTAEWDAEDRLRVTAKLSIRVLSIAEMVPVVIPIGGGHLEKPEDCLVDGRVQAVFPVAVKDGVGFVVPLSAVAGEKSDAPPSEIQVRTHTIELRIHPPTTNEQAGGSSRLNLPAVADSSVTVVRPVKWPGLEVAGLIESAESTLIPATSERPQLVGWLDNRERLDVRWSRQPLARGNVSVIQSRSVCLVDVQSTHLVYRYQLAGKVSSGEVRMLPLRVPLQSAVRQVRVRDAMTSGVLEQPSPYPTVEVVETAEAATPNASSGPAGLLRPMAIELPRALPAEFVVELELILPLPAETENFVIPVANLLADEGAGLTVTSAIPLVAIRAPAEVRLEVSPSDAESVRPTSSDAIITTWSDVPKLTATFEVHAPTTLRCLTSRPMAVRTGHATVEARVSTGRLDWTLTADVETQAAPAFRHQVRIDPRLRIVEASVTEDAAERLLRWARAGDVVTLFLSDKTSSRQSIRLRGLLPLQAPQEVPLPRVELLNATLDASVLTVLRDPSVVVEVTQPANLPRVAPTDKRPLTPDRDQLVGVFQLASLSDPVMLRVRPHDPSATGTGIGSVSESSPRNSFGNNWPQSAQAGIDRVAEVTQRRLGDEWSVADVRRVVIAVGVLIVFALVMAGLRRVECRQWLNHHETVGLLLLGGLWWLCWVQSWLGLVILLIASARRVFGYSPSAEEQVASSESHHPVVL
ncbi:MAG: hypothetical protein HZA46_05060 [Planctomycetales bacterium]|nr:hypothetical protein [Planctomycetales bacterium]